MLHVIPCREQEWRWAPRAYPACVPTALTSRSGPDWTGHPLVASRSRNRMTSWHLPWLRLRLVTRALIALPVTAEVKRELERCAELQRVLIPDGWFN
jgi:hypothetical protein